MNNREIVAENLVRQFGNFTAVNGVSFKVKSGEIFGFLGPNGAGKSTTVAMLTTLILPTTGRATVGGFDVTSQAGDVRRIAGVALQEIGLDPLMEIGLDPLMKSMELLTMQAQFFGASRKEATARAKELLELVKLSEFTSRPSSPPAPWVNIAVVCVAVWIWQWRWPMSLKCFSLMSQPPASTRPAAGISGTKSAA